MPPRPYPFFTPRSPARLPSPFIARFSRLCDPLRRCLPFVSTSLRLFVSLRPNVLILYMDNFKSLVHLVHLLPTARHRRFYQYMANALSTYQRDARADDAHISHTPWGVQTPRCAAGARELLSGRSSASAIGSMKLPYCVLREAARGSPATVSRGLKNLYEVLDERR